VGSHEYGNEVSGSIKIRKSIEQLKSSDFSTSSLIHKLLKTHENNIMKMAG
jgi:hypothetical protein